MGQKELPLLGFILPRPLLHLVELQNELLAQSFLVSKM